MSRILDALERINREASAPLGFGHTTRETKRRSMVLVGALPGKITRNAALMPDLKVDAALVNEVSLEGFEEIIAPLKNVPWGVELPELKNKLCAQWRKKGADFFVFGPQNANVKAIEYEGTGFFLRIPPDLEDRYLRSIETLPVDGIIVGDGVGTPPMNFQQLMDLGALRTMFDKYLLLETSSTLNKRELESLVHMGVDGILVTIDRASSRSLQKLATSLDGISNLSVGKTGRSSALLPPESYALESSSNQEEEGEEF